MTAGVGHVALTDPRAGARTDRGDPGTCHLGDDARGPGAAPRRRSPRRPPSLVLAVGGVGDPGARRRVVAGGRSGFAPGAHVGVVVHAHGLGLARVPTLAAGTRRPGRGHRERRRARRSPRHRQHRAPSSNTTSASATFVHVGPGAVIGGGARIGDGRVRRSGGPRPRPHRRRRRGATIGMGAVVVGRRRAGRDRRRQSARPARPSPARRDRAPRGLHRRRGRDRPGCDGRRRPRRRPDRARPWTLTAA